MPTPTDEDFRAIGFTGAARDYPRDEMALAMFAAWNGVTHGKLPPAMRYFPNAETARAWGRVAMAARAFIAKDARPAKSEVAGAALVDIEEKPS